MVSNREKFVLFEDTSLISLELVSHLDTAGDRSTGINFSLHFLGTGNWSVLFSIPSGEGTFSYGPATCSRAIHAVLDWAAIEFLWVWGCIYLATLLRDTIGVSELVDGRWISTIAGTSSLTVDDDLRRQEDGSIIKNNQNKLVSYGH